MAVLVRQRYPAVHWWCPQLPPSPQAALQAVMQGIAGWPQEDGFTGLAIMGSSLGGFYATAIAERYGCKAVLLNPAVDPARDLSHYLGEQTSWHNPQERFFFEPHFVDELRALNAGPLKNPQNYFAVIAKGDELLDWREMAARYAGANIHLLEGGDHALSDFDLHVPAILEFLGLGAWGVEDVYSEKRPKRG